MKQKVVSSMTIAEFKRRTLLAEMRLFRRVVLKHLDQEITTTGTLQNCGIQDGSVVEVEVSDPRHGNFEDWDTEDSPRGRSKETPPALEETKIDPYDCTNSYAEPRCDQCLKSEGCVCRLSPMESEVELCEYPHTTQMLRASTSGDKDPEMPNSCSDDEDASSAYFTEALPSQEPSNSPDTRIVEECNRSSSFVVAVTVTSFTSATSQLVTSLALFLLGTVMALTEVVVRALSLAGTASLGVVQRVVNGIRRSCLCCARLTQSLVRAWNDPIMGPDLLFFAGVIAGMNPSPILLYAVLKAEIPKLTIGVFFGLLLRAIRAIFTKLYDNKYPDDVDPAVGRKLTLDMISVYNRWSSSLPAPNNHSVGTLPSHGHLNSTTGSGLVGSANETVTRPVAVNIPPPSPLYAQAGQRLLALVTLHGKAAIAWLRDPLPPYERSLDNYFVPAELEAKERLPLLLE